MRPYSRTCTITLIVAAVFSFAGCSGSPQWQITIENKGSSPCSIYVEMGYANANSQGGSQGSSRAYVEDMPAGYKSTLISGGLVETIKSVKLVRGEEEQVLQPNIEIRPGMRYAIVATADGKLESAFESDRQ